MAATDVAADAAGGRGARRQHVHRPAAERTRASARSRSRRRRTPCRRRAPTTTPRGRSSTARAPTARPPPATRSSWRSSCSTACTPKHPPSAIVLLSDGAANAGVNVITVARQAAREKIPIYTVALGTPNGTLPNPEPFEPPVPVPPDPQLMQRDRPGLRRAVVRRPDRRPARARSTGTSAPARQRDPQARGDGRVRDRRARAAAARRRDVDAVVRATPLIAAQAGRHRRTGRSTGLRTCP